MKQDEAADEKDEKKEVVEDNRSLWETFLANAAKNASTHEEATVVVCGDPGCAVPQLLQGMQSSANKVKRDAEQLPYFLNYRYVAADNEIEDALHLHTWTVQDDKHSEQILTVVPDSHIKDGRLSYIICLDAAKPATIQEQFKRWTAFVAKTQEQILKSVGDEAAQELRDVVSRRLQFYTAGNADPSDELLSAEEQAKLEVDRGTPKENVGSQITVVVTKTAEFAKNFPESQSNANEMFELCLLFLRKWSLDYGASLFTFSNRVQATNIKSYVDSVVNGPKSVLEPQVGNVALSELKEEAFFLPAGFDSEMLLNTSNLKNHKNKEFAVIFPRKKKKAQKKKNVYEQASEKEDQKYLKILRFEMERANHTRPQPVVPPPKPKPPGGQTKVREFFNNLLLDDSKSRTSAGRPASKTGKRNSTGNSSRRPGGGKKDYSKDAYAALKLINE